MLNGLSCVQAVHKHLQLYPQLQHACIHSCESPRAEGLQLPQEREAAKAAGAELAERVGRERAAAAAAATAAVDAARSEAEALAAAALAQERAERAAADEAAAQRLHAYEREAAERAREAEREAASRWAGLTRYFFPLLCLRNLNTYRPVP